jgi:plastocyanin
MTRIRVTLILLAFVMAGVRPAVAQQSVDQKDKQFSQSTLTVKAGETVQFTNSDNVAHDPSAKSPDGSKLSSTLQKPGEHLSITFDKLGEYTVQCLIHPKMKLKITAE